MNEQLNFMNEFNLASSSDELNVQNYAFYLDKDQASCVSEHERTSINYQPSTLVTIVDPVSYLVTASIINPVLLRSNTQIALEQQSRFASNTSLINQQIRIFNHQLLNTVESIINAGELYIDVRNFTDSHLVLSDNTVLTSHLTGHPVDDVESAINAIVVKIVNLVCYRDMNLFPLQSMEDMKDYKDMQEEISINSSTDGDIAALILKYKDQEIFAQFAIANNQNKNDSMLDIKKRAVDLFITGSLLPNDTTRCIAYTLIEIDGNHTINRTSIDFSDLIVELEEV